MCERFQGTQGGFWIRACFGHFWALFADTLKSSCEGALTLLVLHFSALFDENRGAPGFGHFSETLLDTFGHFFDAKADMCTPGSVRFLGHVSDNFSRYIWDTFRRHFSGTTFS